MDARRLKLWALLAAPSALVIILALLCLIWPETFWDRFLWKYYWSPIVADAGGDAGGATSEYNWVDTITYGVILAFSAFLMNKLFILRKLRVGLPFFVALTPVILIGSAARVLEDMELFNEPLQYLFISPIIYIMLGLLTLGSIIISDVIERKWPGGGRDQRYASALFIMVPSLLVTLVILAGKGWFNEGISVLPVLLIGALAACTVLPAKGQLKWERLVLTIWLEALAFVVYMYVLWVMKGEWFDHYVTLNMGVEPTSHLGSGGLIFLLMLAATIVMGLLMFAAFKGSKKYRAIISGINIFILAGHMLDASATYVGIDHFGYSEKHVLPSFLIRVTGTALVMFPLKLLFLIPAFIILDVELEKETRENPHLMALVKLTMLVLGAAPGARDLIRLALGV